jgi:hypothetical protein
VLSRSELITAKSAVSSQQSGSLYSGSNLSEIFTLATEIASCSFTSFDRE